VPTPPGPPGPPPLPPAASPHPGESRTFPCDRCGADLVFSIGAQRLECGHCGFGKDLAPGALPAVEEHDLEAGLRRQAARRAGERAAAGTQEVSCRACGGTVRFEGTLTATACAYCGEPILRDRVHAAPDRVPVDGLLTFAVEGPAARAALAAWVKGLWFAPGEFLRRGVDGALEGAYLPYFTFDAMTSTEYAGQRGDHYWVEVGSGQQRRREQRTRWSPAWGGFQRFFDDVLVPAVQALPPALLGRLEPWPLQAVLPFTPGALAGKLAHTYDVELPAAAQAARRAMEAAIEAEVRRRIGGDVQRVESIRTGWAALTYKHLLLPVWLLAYRYQGKSYRVAVNACTGEVHGERPWSPWKIGAAVVLGLIAAGVVAYLAQQH
jgi:DNA-directed RNA polymerase subunit RPC12/RpoP